MKVGIFSSNKFATGNFTTALRIGSILESIGVDVEHVDLACLGLPEQEAPRLKHKDFSAAIGIHAFRSGQYLLELDIPYAIIFGGTDLHIHVNEPSYREVISKAVTRASKLVAFDFNMADKARNYWPALSANVVVVPQSVQTEPEESFSVGNQLKLPEHSIMLLMPSGLREVKDPRYLLQSFADWHKSTPEVHLVIAGPELDTQTASAVKNDVNRFEGIHYVGPLSKSKLHSAMIEAALVVNSSHSEGNSNALLEAMQLGTPVIARNNLGNATLLGDKEEHGFLFDTPDEFINLAKRVIGDKSLQAKVSNNAKDYIHKFHSFEAEREGYRKLIRHEL